MNIQLYISKKNFDVQKAERFFKERRVTVQFVDLKKQNRLRTTAAIYLAQNPTDLQPRFDVIEIYAPQGMETNRLTINHLEDAFQ